MWDKLKDILKASGGKAVIVEDGDPKYIVLPVDEYLKLSGTTDNAPQQAPATENNPSPLSSNPSSGSPFGAQPANDNESIFRGSIDPSAADSPVDLSDLETSDTPSLADYSERNSDIDLEDLPL